MLKDLTLKHLQNNICILDSTIMTTPMGCKGRDALARHGPGDPEIYGTARDGKYWHGKSWHGTENLGTEKSWHGMARKTYHKIVFFGENNFGSTNPGLFARIQNPTFSHS